MFLTNFLELSRRSVDPWVEENIVTMLQLGAIKKIHRDFFFRVLILARMERGKDYGKRLFSIWKRWFRFPIRRSWRTNVPKYLHDPRKLYTQRGPNLIENPRVQISVEKDAPYIQANAAMRRLILQTQSGKTKPCCPELITEGSQAEPGGRFITTLQNLIDNKHLPLY